MNRITRALKRRNAIMIKINRYFLKKQIAWNPNISCSVCEHFAKVIDEGMKLIHLFRELKLTQLDELLKVRIKTYLNDCEKSISLLGCDALEEFCDLIPVLNYLANQRLLICRILDGNSDDRTHL